MRTFSRSPGRPWPVGGRRGPPSALFEVLVVGDGSTDGSAAIAEGFGPPVRCIRQEHVGIGAARNRGVQAAQGDYLAFLDADDLWESAKLATQVAVLADQPRADAVFSGVKQFIPHRPPGRGVR